LEQRTHQILVVDDDAKIGELIQSLFRIGTLDLQCVFAMTTSQGLFKLENQEFDLVLVDRNIQGRSGIEFVGQLRRMPKLHSQKIILMSGALEKNDVQAALLVGINDILVKPFTLVQLLRKIRPYLKKVR
jgi:CheY-like chemotaxis protein